MLASGPLVVVRWPPVGRHAQCIADVERVGWNMRKPSPMACSRCLWSMVLFCALGAIVSAQAMPAFAGPFVYDQGPAAFGAVVRVSDLDGDSRDDLVIRPLLPGALR